MKRTNIACYQQLAGLILCSMSFQCTGTSNPPTNTNGGVTGVGGSTSGGASSSQGGATSVGGKSATGGQSSTAGSNSTSAGGAGTPDPRMNFFVSSNTSATANLGGLQGADQRCQDLATAVGLGNKTWVAYLSADSPATNARDRIGNGPYYNFEGALLAADKTALHARSGDPALFIDEHGNRINGQWSGSPTPNQHDILTGSLGDGTLNASYTCQNWTAITGNSFVGHTDGLGPSMNPAPPYNSWNSSHTGQCGNTTPGGGAGRIYCFTSN